MTIKSKKYSVTAHFNLIQPNLFFFFFFKSNCDYFVAVELVVYDLSIN